MIFREAQAGPAEARHASSTDHVVTTSVLLNGGLALEVTK